METKSIEEFVEEIISSLKALDPNKIILFGSYANGTATPTSDTDIMLVKDNLKTEDATEYERRAKKRLLNFILKHKKSVDVLSIPSETLKTRTDHFYKVEILQKGKILYAK